MPRPPERGAPRGGPQPAAVDPRNGLRLIGVPEQFRSAFKSLDGCVLYLFERCRKFGKAGRLAKSEGRVVIVTDRNVWQCREDGIINRCSFVTDCVEIVHDTAGGVGLRFEPEGRRRDYDMLIEFSSRETQAQLVGTLTQLRVALGAPPPLVRRSYEKVDSTDLRLSKPSRWEFKQQPIMTLDALRKEVGDLHAPIPPSPTPSEPGPWEGAVGRDAEPLLPSGEDVLVVPRPRGDERRLGLHFERSFAAAVLIEVAPSGAGAAAGAARFVGREVRSVNGAPAGSLQDLFALAGQLPEGVPLRLGFEGEEEARAREEARGVGAGVDDAAVDLLGESVGSASSTELSVAALERVEASGERELSAAERERVRRAYGVRCDRPDDAADGDAGGGGGADGAAVEVVVARPHPRAPMGILLREPGVSIQHVRAGGPGDRAGLGALIGRTVTHVDAIPLRSISDFAGLCHGKPRVVLSLAAEAGRLLARDELGLPFGFAVAPRRFWGGSGDGAQVVVLHSGRVADWLDCRVVQRNGDGTYNVQIPHTLASQRHGLTDRGADLHVRGVSADYLRSVPKGGGGMPRRMEAVELSRVDDASPAMRAGLADYLGRTVTHVDGAAVATPEEVHKQCLGRRRVFVRFGPPHRPPEAWRLRGDGDDVARPWEEAPPDAEWEIDVDLSAVIDGRAASVGVRLTQMAWVAEGGKQTFLFLDSVVPGSPADAAGAGAFAAQRLTHADGAPVHELADLAAAIEGRDAVRLRFAPPSSVTQASHAATREEVTAYARWLALRQGESRRHVAPCRAGGLIIPWQRGGAGDERPYDGGMTSL